MGTLKFLIVLCLFVYVYSKELHFKNNLEVKDKDAKGFMNLFNNGDIFTKNERYARHLKAVTESVIEHLLNEIKQQYYSSNYNPNSPIPRLIRNLNKELKKNERIKLQNEKLKRKNATKKKNKNKNTKKRLVTTKPML